MTICRMCEEKISPGELMVCDCEPMHLACAGGYQWIYEELSWIKPEDV